MSDYRPNPLNPILSQVQKALGGAEMRERWESSRVEFLLRHLNMATKIWQLRKDNSKGFLDFSNVNDQLGLPMVFEAAPLTGKLPIHQDVKSVHPLWFKNFDKLPVSVIYFERYREYIAGQDLRPFALVFPRKGFAQGMCIHSGTPEVYLQPGQGAHVFRSKKYDKDFYVQPYKSVLDTIRGLIGDDGNDCSNPDDERE